jgi:hypothetical protein
MKYSKPEVTVLDNALTAIQDQTEKPGTLDPDNMTVPFIGTTSAYQADE